MAETFPYEHCPKCQHTPLPADQSLPATCPNCAIVLAKFAPVAPVSKAIAVTEENELTRWQSFKAHFMESVLHVPDQVTSAGLWSRALMLVVFAIWGCKLIWLDFRELGVGESFLHGPLLIFHEAGHVIFRLFGEFITVLGGTLGQLIMPAIMTLALLLRNRDPFAAAIGLWFFGVSVLDVAPYVYDALHPQLILLGGNTGEEGGHDWIYLLGEAGQLARAQSLGWLIHKLGAAIVFIAIAFAAWTLLRQKNALSFRNEE